MHFTQYTLCVHIQLLRLPVDIYIYIPVDIYIYIIIYIYIYIYITFIPLVVKYSLLNLLSLYRSTHNCVKLFRTLDYCSILFSESSNVLLM